MTSSSERTSTLAPRARRLANGAVVVALLAIGLLLVPTGAAISADVGPDEGFEPLFNGDNLDGWYTYTSEQGRNNDTEGIVTVADGELRILDIENNGQTEAFGYVATEEEYADFHLRFEYQWGEERFVPRENLLRDSGVLYHMVGADKVWPTSVESQVQEGDTGDFFFLSGPSGRSERAPGSVRYQAGGDPATGNNQAAFVADTLTGWNTSEIIVRGNSAVHIVNGEVVNRGFDFTLNGDDLSAGKIAFQIEGATISYRNIEIKDLSDDADQPRILAYYETEGFTHASISTALDTVDELAAENGIVVDRSDDSAVFTDANLANYDAVVFISTTGDVLNDDEQAAFEQYIRGGGGYAGIHAATDTEYDWPWYGELVGAYFDSHPSIQEALIEVEDDTHPSTEHLGETWTRTDEWYDFQTNPRDDVNVLLTLDEDSYQGGSMGEDHPIAWYHEFDGGRSWYTAGGHTSESYGEPDFQQHILGGILWAADIVDTADPVDPPVDPVDPPAGETLDPSEWTFTASSAQAATGNTVDGDITTRWSTGTKQEPGQFFQIDLGSVQTFDRIDLATDVSQPFDYPRGYEVYASDDPDALGDPIATGVGSAQTTIEFDATTARYIRIVQTGSDVFRWWSIYELDIYGASEPVSIPDPSTWEFSASSTNEDPNNVADGDIATRWSTSAKQQPGQFFQIDFGEASTFTKIELALDEATQPFDYPREYEVYASNDPTDFGEPIAAGTGETLTVIDVDETTAQYVRIVQTGSDVFRWWSIYELGVS